MYRCYLWSLTLVRERYNEISARLLRHYRTPTHEWERSTKYSNRTTAQAYTQWSRTESDIASMTHAANARMSALYDLVNAQRQSMIWQYRHFTSSIEGMNSITAVLPAVIRSVTDFGNALVQVSELRIVLFDALHGRLSWFLSSSDHDGQNFA